MTTPWRILVAEDNLGDAILIEEAAKRRSLVCEIEHYFTAPEAIAALLEAGAGGAPVPDLILLDYNLPGGQGPALLRAAAQNQRLNGVPRAVLSSFLREDEEEEVTRLGAMRVVLKPPDLNQFFEEIGQTIESLLTARGPA